MSVFIRQKNNKHYLVVRTKASEKWIPLRGEDLDNLRKALEIKQILAEQTVEITCVNPECSNRIITTKQQKQDFLISFKKKYDKLVLPCCSKECQEKVLKLIET